MSRLDLDPNVDKEDTPEKLEKGGRLVEEEAEWVLVLCIILGCLMIYLLSF